MKKFYNLGASYKFLDMCPYHDIQKFSITRILMTRISGCFELIFVTVMQIHILRRLNSWFPVKVLGTRMCKHAVFNLTLKELAGHW